MWSERYEEVIFEGEGFLELWSEGVSLIRAVVWRYISNYAVAPVIFQRYFKLVVTGKTD